MTPQEQTTDSSNIHLPPLCSVCHQKILPEYYFCPNCGNKLAEVPLSTTFMTQLGLYLFSIILPSICFLFIAKWKGNTYAKSTDPVARRIGIVAWILLLSSTTFTFWSVYYVTQKVVSTISSSINSSIGDYGY